MEKECNCGNFGKCGISNLIADELDRANEIHPPFASEHEAYAVIREEVDEVIHECELMCDKINHLWDCVKHDEDTTVDVRGIRINAVFLIQEAIQVAAMCDKALISKEKRNE